MLGVTDLRGRGRRPTRCCARSPSELGVARHLLARPASACTSASPARPCPTRTSAARARRARAASAAARAWSAAATTPRTRWSRTTSGSPSAPASRSCPSAPSPTSARSAPPDGSDGYAVTSERSGAWVRKRRSTLTARGVVVAAGPLGTNQLLQRCRRGGSLPRLSDRVGYLVRTNSRGDLGRHHQGRPPRLHASSIAITSSFYPDPDTHIENVTYGPRRRLDRAAVHEAQGRRAHQAHPPAAARAAGRGAR